MTIEEMKQRKIELGLSNEMLAAQSGVPLGTVQKIFCGVTKAPRKATIDALVKVLGDPSAAESTVYRAEAERLASRIDPCMVSEEAIAYGAEAPARPPLREKRQGEYTLEDYYALPDERRVELIDGVIYDMSAPSVRHQLILGELYAQLLGCPRIQSGECTVFLSPSDVQLDCDNRTMVQPDIFIICGEVDVDASHTMGAPDMAIEILSPSTRSKDMLLKLHKYYHAGVREYWIIDPQHRKILVYDLTDEALYPDEYDFESTVPVGLSGGECRIDFNRISQKVFKS